MKTRQEIAECITEDILKDRLVIKLGFDPIDISDGINWEYKHESNTRTYAVYLHAFDYLKSIVMINQNKPDEQLLTLANNILRSWIDFNSSDHKFHQYVWNEHAVANRLQNFIYYYENLEGANIGDTEFSNFVLQHCNYLIDEKNYKANNHGIMMDQSIMTAVKYIKDEQLKSLYFSKALYRVKLAIFRDFSRRGVHLENSPEYHRMVHKILHQLNQVLIKNNIKIGAEEHRLLKSS